VRDYIEIRQKLQTKEASKEQVRKWKKYCQFNGKRGFIQNDLSVLNAHENEKITGFPILCFDYKHLIQPGV
jgi:hypothetical protein